MTVSIGELARICRSKNAGMALVTIDVSFDDDLTYMAAKKALTPDVVGGLYRVEPVDVKIISWDRMRTLKLTFPRSPRSGGPGDLDVYGCQLHAPILALPVNIEVQEAG